MTELYTLVQSRFGVDGLETPRDDLAFICAPAGVVVPLLHHLKTRAGYAHLSFLTAVDRLEEGELQLTYMLTSASRKHRLGVRVRIGRDEPTADSIHDQWAQAATYQRELHEMYGVVFPGSPGLTEPFALESWDGPPPMRRDFDTRSYSEETYFPREGRHTTDPRQRMNKTLHPADCWETEREDV